MYCLPCCMHPTLILAFSSRSHCTPSPSTDRALAFRFMLATLTLLPGWTTISHTLLPGWTTISQATYGAQISEIQSQLAGGPATRTLQAELGLLWTLPADVSDSRGLGGGVTWAIDPALCGPLLPNFREDVAFINFITCEDVRASIARAFNQWSANNKWVNFQEVTSECDALGASWGQPTQYGHAGCSIAEIWVTSITSAGRRLQGGPNLTFTELELNGALPVATATPHIRATPDFRHTSGQVPFFAASPGAPRDFVETYGGTFAINVEPDVCWCAVTWLQSRAVGCLLVRRASARKRPWARLPSATAVRPPCHRQVPGLQLLLWLPLAQGRARQRQRREGARAGPAAQRDGSRSRAALRDERRRDTRVLRRRQGGEAPGGHRRRRQAVLPRTVVRGPGGTVCRLDPVPPTCHRRVTDVQPTCDRRARAVQPTCARCAPAVRTGASRLEPARAGAARHAHHLASPPLVQDHGALLGLLRLRGGGAA